MTPLSMVCVSRYSIVIMSLSRTVSGIFSNK